MSDSKTNLRTVKAPEAFAESFARAEQIVSEYFRGRRDDPERGTIDIDGQRYVLVRAASLSVEFFNLVRDLYGSGRRSDADDFSRNLLFDLAQAVGRSDARRFHERMHLEDPIERLTAGPVHFSHTGWAFVDIDESSRPAPDESFYLLYDHPYSFEASAWLDAGIHADFPVCIMNAGYSSGWCQESFDVRLVSSEVLCRARGDEACRFIMAPPSEIEGHVERYIEEKPHLAGQIRGYQIPDFFARKRMEEELVKSRDELERRVAERTAELERTNQALRREIVAREHAEKQLLQTAKLEAVGRLAGGIAHDFNNLMGVVIGHASHLENRLEAEDPLLPHLREIRQTSEEAAQLANQLNTFGRTQLTRLEEVDLNVIVNETMFMLKRLIGEEIDLRLRLAPDSGSVRADRGQLRQVIMNLVVNARDAMPGGGVLRIETSSAERGHTGEKTGNHAWARIAVADSGVGMDDDTQAQAFDPFFTTKDPGVGTGLGLSTVHRIVTLNGGKISVASEPGRGATFTVLLPRSGDRVEPEPSRSVEATPPRGSETVLVVEDQTALREMVVTVLGELGYLVLEAADPQAALELVRDGETRFDLLLTDVVMPGMSGRVLADRLCESRPTLKVLFISGYADDEVLRHGVDDGEVELLAKPFTILELAARIRKVLDS